MRFFKQKKYFVIFLALILVNIECVYGYYQNTEKTAANLLSAASLNIDIKKEVNKDDLAHYNIEVINEGNLDFVYGMKAVDFKGDLCDRTSIKVIHKDKEIFTGSLVDLSFEKEQENKTMKLNTGKDKPQTYEFEFMIPVDLENTNPLAECVFKIKAMAWMEEFSYKKAFWDQVSLDIKLLADDFKK